MAVIRCKMCGGDLVLVEGQSVAECEYCGSRQTVPAADNEKKLTLFARAGRLRAACEFDKAAGIYETIVSDFPEEAEAYWGLVLCKYGIEYVDDPGTGKKIPTCHRSSFESILEDTDLEQALENADSAARRLYREEAKQIEQIRKGIIAVSANEQPYDIFICYKETDENGDRTLDSVLAQDIYDALTTKGYRVFFSRITLEDKLGVEYEPYIFAALNSAKIMLAVGTDYEFFNAVWVKNEWSRYLKIMTQDKNKHLIPCYKGIDVYDMPREFAKLQAQDLGKMGAIQDILRGVEKLLPRSAEVQKESVPISQSVEASPTQPLLRRVFLFLEDGNWSRADEYCEKILDMNPECAEAYLGKMLAELQIHRKENLVNCTSSFAANAHYIKALRFADPVLKNELEKSLSFVISVIETEKNSVIQNGVLRKYSGRQSRILIPKSVRRIDESAFEGCNSLTAIEISENVAEIEPGAFSGCSSLSEIRVSKKNPAFYNSGTCLIDKKRKTVVFGVHFQDIPVDGSIWRIGDRAFSGNKNLVDLRIPESIQEIGEHAFAGCSNLKSIEIPDSLTSVAATAFPHNSGICLRIGGEHPVFRMAGSSLIHKLEKRLVFGMDVQELPADGSVTRIGAYAFHGCAATDSITIPDCIRSIDDYAFSECGIPSVSFFGKTVKIADTAFGREPTGLTVFAFEDSDAAKWARKNHIPTKENAQMKRISTAALLERGNLAMKDGDWSKAVGFFDGVLKNDSQNAMAYIGRTLVQERCHSLDGLTRQRAALYRSVSSEKLYIKENTAHITEMAEKYCLTGYVDGNEIRQLYVFDRSYTSEVSGRQKQYLEEKSWWLNHKQLSQAEKFADENVAEQITIQRNQILSHLSGQIQIAKDTDLKNVAELKAAYEAHIAEADKKAEEIYNEGLIRREKDYQGWQEQALQEEDPRNLKKLAENFEALGDYQNSRILAEDCRRRAAEEQEKIAVEKKRQRAIAAEKKKARCRRLRPVLAVIAVITAACIFLTGPVSQLFMNQWLPEFGYQRAEKLFDQGRHDDAIAKFEALGDYEDAAVRASEIRYLQAEALFADGRYQEAMTAFESLGSFEDSSARAVECELTALASQGIRQAAIAYYKVGNRSRSMELWHSAVLHKPLAAGLYHTVGLKTDGSVLATGRDLDSRQKAIPSNGQTQVQNWRNIISVSAGLYHTVGLREDGTVVATGLNDSGQCEVSGWTDIVSVAAGEHYTAGLRADGTVVIAGKDVESAGNWRNVIEIAGGRDFLLGLLSDQTTVNTNASGFEAADNVKSLAAAEHYLCLKEDGSIVGKQIETNGKKLESIWAGGYIVLGILEDGTAAYRGRIVSEWTIEESEKHQLELWDTLKDNDIAAFAAGIRHAVLLKQDGTVTAFGENAFGGCNVKNWSDIRIPEIPEDTFVLPEDIFTMDVPETVDRDDGPAYVEAEKLLADGEILKAAMAFGKLGDFEDSRERSITLWNAARPLETISAGQFRTMAVQKNGTMLSTDSRFSASGIVTVSDGSWHYAGLRSNGTVVAKVISEFRDKWQNINRDKGGHSGQCDVADWRDMVQVSAGDMHTLGLRKNGTVTGAGINDFGRWQTDTWQNIVAVSAGYDHSVGLHADGYVFTIGGNKNGVADTTLWKNIVAVSAGKFFTVGLQMDGTVIASGNNDFGQCDVSAYRDIVAVSAGNTHTVLLRSDGTVIAIGGNEYGQCDVSTWRDIVAIDAGGWHTVGLKSDGTMVAVGHTGDGRCDVSDWKNVKLPYKEMEGFPDTWTDGKLPETPQKPAKNIDSAAAYAEAENLLASGEIAKAAIAFGKLGDYEDARKRSFALWDQVAVRETIAVGEYHTVALKKDGTVLAAGQEIPCNVDNWENIVAVAADAAASYGLKSDGTVVTTHAGNKTALWEDIVSISEDGQFGLRMDGTVVTSADNFDLSGWSDMTAVYSIPGTYPFASTVIGVKSDGTFVAAEPKDMAEGYRMLDLKKWSKVVAFSGGGEHSGGAVMGLKANGTVVALRYDGTFQYGETEALGIKQHDVYNVTSWKNIKQIEVAKDYGMLGVKTNGTVVSIPNSTAWGADLNRYDFSDWSDIAAISASRSHIVGLKSDGTLVATGNSDYGSCDVSDWSDIKLPYKDSTDFPDTWTDGKLPETQQKPAENMDPAAAYAEAENLLASGETAKAAIAFGKLGDYEDARKRSFALWDQVAVRDTIAVGNGFTLALKTDGTVYSTEGFAIDGMDEIENWTDIIAVSAHSHGMFAGLKADGTVVVAGGAEQFEAEIREWHDIVAVSAGHGVMGLKSDGTVVAASYKDYDFSDWTEIIAIENTGLHVGTGGYHAVGLKADGTVVAENEGDFYGNRYGQCDVEDWSDIVKISADTYLTLGLKADGTVVATGLKDKRENFPGSGWEYLGQDEVSDWTDIRDICAHGYFLTMGVKKDGSVVAAGRLKSWYDPRKWTDIVAVAATENHAVGLKSDGTLVATGHSTDGRCDVSDWMDIKLPN